MFHALCDRCGGAIYSDDEIVNKGCMVMHLECSEREDEVVVVCTVHGSSYKSFATEAMRRLFDESIKRSAHASEMSLSVPKNEKTKGQHCQPFYRNDRW